jgi:excisionase family DNA binding protein
VIFLLVFIDRIIIGHNYSQILTFSTFDPTRSTRKNKLTNKHDNIAKQKNIIVMQNLSFDQLPLLVAQLIVTVGNVEKHLLDKKEDHSETEEKFMTISEAAKFLNLAKATIYSKVSRGELPSMKRGKRLYFSNLELTNYIKEGKKKSNLEIEQEADAVLNRLMKRAKNE